MKLEEQLRRVMRKEHYSLRTEETYVAWYRRFVLWHGKRHPNELGAPEVSAFLTHLAVNRGVSAATQNQALNAIVFLYRKVLGLALEGIDGERAKVRKRVPVVMSVEETGCLLRGVGMDPAGLVVRLPRRQKSACFAKATKAGDAAIKACGGTPQPRRAATVRRHAA